MLPRKDRREHAAWSIAWAVVALSAIVACLFLSGCSTTYKTKKNLTIHTRALTVEWCGSEKSAEPEPGGVWIFIDMTDNPAAKAAVDAQAEATVKPEALP